MKGPARGFSSSLPQGTVWSYELQNLSVLGFEDILGKHDTPAAFAYFGMV